MATTRRVISLLAATAIVTAIGRVESLASSHQGDGKTAPSSRPAASEAIPIVVGAPADLESLWKRLGRPDFILRRGEEATQAVPPAEDRRPSTVVAAVAIEGEVRGDLASIRVEYRIVARGDGPRWATLGLERVAVTGAREGGVDAALRVAEGAAWQVEVTGPGEHRVAVEAAVPVKAGAEGRRVEVGIVEAAMTRVRLDVPGRVPSAEAGPAEPVDARPVDAGRRTRLEARLSARPRVALSWQVEPEAGPALPPLLDARGEIAVDLDGATFRTKSSWRIAAVRGSATSLTVALDPADELVDLSVDGQGLAIEGLRAADRASATVPLPGPLRPGSPARVVLATRRVVAEAAPDAGPPPLEFRGFSWRGAASQSGMIGVATEGDLWVDGSGGPRLRAVDPRTELTEELRTRPMTALAYRFVEQPFLLRLRAVASPPRLHVEARTTLVVGEGSTQVESRLAARVARGRPLELQVDCPAGLEFESVGPPGPVDSWRIDGADDGDRVLTLRLSDAAREAGAFALALRGRSRPAIPGDVAAPIFRPTGVDGPGPRVAVTCARGLAVEPVDGRDSRPAPAAGDWTWPAGLDPALAPAVFLEPAPAADRVEVRVAARPRQPRTESTASLRVLGDRAEFEQDLSLNAAFEGSRRLDVAVPEAIRSSWSIEVAGRARAEAVEPGSMSPGGVTRVELARPLGVTPRLRIRGRLERPAGAGLPWTFEAPIVGVAPAGCPAPTIASCRLRVSPGPEVATSVDPAGWRRDDEPPAAADQSPGQAFVLDASKSGLTPPDAPRITATARVRVALPGLVASRLWLTTSLPADGPTSTTARYRVVVHRGQFRFSLPKDARLVRATVADEAVAAVEALPTPGEYQFRIPASAEGPVAVGIEFQAPRAAGSGWPRLEPPALPGGGVVQQTYWEVAIAPASVLLGAPAGWSDENSWTWDAPGWRRVPARPSSWLDTWIRRDARPAAATGTAGTPGSQAYLFGRAGDVVGMAPTVVSRRWLLGGCSGLALLVGVGALSSRRRPSRWAAAASAFATLGIASLAEPSTALILAQSSAVGVSLTLIAAVLQRFIDARRFTAAPADAEGAWGGASDAANAGAGAALVASAAASFALVGSDDPTSIRPRPDAEALAPIGSTRTDATRARTGPSDGGA